MRRLKHCSAGRPTCNHAKMRCLAPSTANIKRATLGILSQPCSPGKTAALLAWGCRRRPANCAGALLSYRLRQQRTITLVAAFVCPASPAEGMVLLRSPVRMRFGARNGHPCISIDQNSTGEALEGIGKKGRRLRLRHKHRQ